MTKTPYRISQIGASSNTTQLHGRTVESGGPAPVAPSAAALLSGRY